MLLSINTCGSPGSVALGSIDSTSGTVGIVAQAELAERTYSAQLIPKIAGMLAAAGMAVHDLEAIVAVRGPGSFTGTRVGLSVAKGLAEASGAWVIGLSRLELLAARSGRDHVLAAIDAGRGEFYVGEYRQGRALRETLLTAAELSAAAQAHDAGVLVYEAPAGATSLPKEEGFAGAGKQGLAAGQGRPGVPDPIYLPAPDAADALRFGVSRFRAGLFDDIELLDANYLRRSDAEIFSAPASLASRQVSKLSSELQ